MLRFPFQVNSVLMKHAQLTALGKGESSHANPD